MKKTVFLIIILLILFSKLFAQDKASDVLENAWKQAKIENKNVMVIFHASWCGWCKRMDKNINDPSCKELFERNYIIKHLVVWEAKDKKHLENPGAAELFEKHADKYTGIPFWLVYDKNGKLLTKSFDSNGKNIGCPASEHEVKVFLEILKKTSDLNEQELSIIKEKFQKKS